MSARVHEELSRCVIEMLLKEPFFGHLLSGVVRSVSETATSTAAVQLEGSQIRMIVNPDFFMKQIRSKAERVAVVKHETLHLMFKHLLRLDHTRHDPLIFNLAADLVVNQFIKRPWKLPEGAILLSTFPDLGLQPDQTLEWYYDKLIRLQNEMRRKGWKQSGCPSCGASSQGQRQQGQQGQGQGQGQQNQQGQGQSQQGQGQQNQQGQGQQGSSTCPSCGQPTGQGGGGGGGNYSHSKTSAPKSAEVIERMAGKTWHSDHGQWGQGEQGEQDIADGELDRLMEQAWNRAGPKAWGSVPGPLRSLIEQAIARRKPQVDWRRTLRLFAASSRRSRVANTMRRKSKRYGTYPGIKIKRFQRIAVIVDTSGSVNPREIEIFFAEIHGIWRQGAEITVIEADAAVQHVWNYRGQLPQGVHGRGGTVFDPAFQYLRDNRRDRYDGCIYLTDGYASAPEVKPPCKLMWVVTSDGSVGEHLRYGRAVKLPASN